MNRLEFKIDICWIDWYMNGWGNFNCQGFFLWVYQGNGNVCVNVLVMVVLVSFGIFFGVVEFGLVNLLICGFVCFVFVVGIFDVIISDFSFIVQLIEVNGDGDSGFEK